MYIAYIAPFHIFLPSQVYLIFKKVVMYKQDLKQVYKDGIIFQLFQTWEKYGNEFWKKARSQTLSHLKHIL